MERPNIKKEIIQWIVFLAILTVLWTTGWHKPIIARVQRAVLATGIARPEIPQIDSIGANPGAEMLLVNEKGNQVKLSDFRGKPVFLNFWATWCTPCLAEMPGIENLYNAVDNNEVQFVLVAIDDDFNKALAFKQRKNYNFPIYRIAGTIPSALKSDEVPTTYVLDGNGNIKMKHSGMAEYDNPKFISYLNELANRTPGTAH